MKYYYVIHTETENIFAEAGFFPTQAFVYKHGGYTLTVGSENKRGYELVTAVLTSESDTEAYLSVCAEGTGEYYSFNGICDCERVFRQSPHDHTRYQFKMEMSAIPMIAVSSSENTDIFISDNPSFFDNATTQRIIPSENRAYLSSGDPGGAPNFPESDRPEALRSSMSRWSWQGAMKV